MANSSNRAVLIFLVKSLTFEARKAYRAFNPPSHKTCCFPIYDLIIISIFSTIVLTAENKINVTNQSIKLNFDTTMIYWPKKKINIIPTSEKK